MREFILFEAGGDGELMADAGEFCFLFLRYRNTGQVAAPSSDTPECISRVAKVALLGDRCDVLMYVVVDMQDEASVHNIPTELLREWKVR